MKYLKYPLTFISPVLAYFSFFGSQGASNLLIAWTAFGLILSFVLALFTAIVFLGLAVSTDEIKLKNQKKIDDFYESLVKLKKFSFHNIMDIGCFVFYVWAGWWGLAIMEAIPFSIVKIIGVIAASSRKDSEE